MALGSELLIADGQDGDRKGLREYFDQRGYVCTSVDTAADARGVVTRKFFPVALIDVDIDEPGAGIDLVRYIREKSRPTSVILLTSDPSFEAAVTGFLAGVIDVIHKVPAQIEHLGSVVAHATEVVTASQGDSELFREVRGVLDESFKVMLTMSRTVYSHLSIAAMPLRPVVLLVDGEQAFLKEVSELIQDKEWDIGGEMNGGAALDRGMSTRIDIVASRLELMDLGGSMVIKTIQAQSPETLGLLYTSADGGGRIDQLERGQTEHTERPFRGAAHLVTRIQALVDQFAQTAQERRFIKAFSNDHRAYLKRYAELKLKIDRLISG